MFGTPKYQRFPYYWPHCPEGFAIKSEDECRKAIASLGVTNGGTPWTGSSAGLPSGCSLQKKTDSTIFNQGSSGKRRHDLAPVCHWTGEEPPPDFFRVSRESVTEWRGEEHTITVKHSRSRAKMASPVLAILDRSATKKRHQESTGILRIQRRLPLTARFGLQHGCTPRMRCEAVGAVYKGEHQAGRHSRGIGALRGLQTSPGHCNSMFQESFRGFAVAHGG